MLNLFFRSPFWILGHSFKFIHHYFNRPYNQHLNIFIKEIKKSNKKNTNKQCSSHGQVSSLRVKHWLIKHTQQSWLFSISTRRIRPKRNIIPHCHNLWYINRHTWWNNIPNSLIRKWIQLVIWQLIERSRKINQVKLIVFMVCQNVVNPRRYLRNWNLWSR